MMRDRIGDIARNILGELEHDCPGCLQLFILNITRTEVETNSKLVAWSAMHTKKDEMIYLIFADKQGKIVEQMNIERPVH